MGDRIDITDDMIRAALDASNRTRRHLDPSGEMRMRAALEAAAPLIVAQAIRTMKSSGHE